MDKPIGKDDNGEPVFPDYVGGEDVETAYIRQEEDREYNEAVEELMRSFDKEELRLLKCFKKMTIEEIAAELDLSVPTVIDRRNMYMEMFTMRWLMKNQERQEMVKGLVNSLPEDEQILYFYMGKKLPDTEIAERLGIHRKTVVIARTSCAGSSWRGGLKSILRTRREFYLSRFFSFLIWLSFKE